MSKNILAILATTATACMAMPACAQDNSDDSVLDHDNVTIGVGAIYGPSYEGSDDARVSPIPAIRGKISGISINPRPRGLAVDLIPDGKDQKVDFILGPVAGLSFNRARGIKDPVVRAAGKLNMAVELGVSGGFTVNRVLHDYDWLTFSTDVKWDVANAYKGMTWNPSVTYTTPLNKATLVTVSAYARHVDDNFARYYYSVTPAQSAASGLPEFNAKGGWDKVGIGTLVTYDLSGDLRDGGFALLGVLNYSRMLNDGKTTPFTSLRGDPNQWTAGLGVAYTF